MLNVKRVLVAPTLPACQMPLCTPQVRHLSTILHRAYLPSNLCILSSWLHPTWALNAGKAILNKAILNSKCLALDIHQFVVVIVAVAVATHNAVVVAVLHKMLLPVLMLLQLPSKTRPSPSSIFTRSRLKINSSLYLNISTQSSNNSNQNLPQRSLVCCAPGTSRTTKVQKSSSVSCKVQRLSTPKSKRQLMSGKSISLVKNLRPTRNNHKNKSLLQNKILQTNMCFMLV
mmetsp:Transcript_3072/g.4485  ORF Transcript_3072/g.4485 Transcript_3072/m.4485 type:complete len:230 (-) Transcript_3072:240-929(-)